MAGQRAYHGLCQFKATGGTYSKGGKANGGRAPRKVAGGVRSNLHFHGHSWAEGLVGSKAHDCHPAQRFEHSHSLLALGDRGGRCVFTHRAVTRGLGGACLSSSRWIAFGVTGRPSRICTDFRIGNSYPPSRLGRPCRSPASISHQFRRVFFPFAFH